MLGLKTTLLYQIAKSKDVEILGAKFNLYNSVLVQYRIYKFTSLAP